MSERNVIIEVGFGVGDLRVGGDKRNNTSYRIETSIPLELRIAKRVPFHFDFAYEHIEKELTYDFFKANIICIANSWICDTEY